MTNVPKTSPQRVEYRCPYLEITFERSDFGGFSKDYYVVNFKRRGGVVILRDQQVLMVRQYRHLARGDSWEIPGGTIEDSEDIESGLIRECLEETGVRPRALRRLVEYFPGLDNVDNRTTIFLAEEALVCAPFRPNPQEILEIAWVPLGTCLAWIDQALILDAMTIAGLLACNRVAPHESGLVR